MNKLRDVMLALRARLSMEFQMLLSNFFLAQIFLQLALLPLLGHKEAIGTLGYPIASKLED